MKILNFVAVSALTLSFNISADTQGTEKANMYVPPVDDIEIGAAVFGGTTTDAVSDVTSDTGIWFIPPEDDIEIGAAIFGDYELSSVKKSAPSDTNRFVPNEDDIEIGAAVLE